MKIIFEKTLPYISLFVLLFAVYLIFSVIRDLNPNLIPYKIHKLLNIFLAVVVIIIELSKLRDNIWNIWKKIPTTIHFVMSCFFSFIILKVIPITLQKVWIEDNEKQNENITD